MFNGKEEKITIEIEIAGSVVFRKKYIVRVFERDKHMLKRKAERDSKGNEWALFVVKKRESRTWYTHRKVSKNVTTII